MATLEDVQRGIDTLLESIRQGWFDIATKPLSKEERGREREAIAHCEAELLELLVKRDELRAKAVLG